MKAITALFLALWTCTSCVSVYDRTSLHSTAAAGDIKAAKTLLAGGTRVNAKGVWDRTPLLHAARWGRVEIVRLLLEAGAEVSARDHWDHTPLIEAASWGHPEIVKLLLEAGAEVNAKSKNGMTPLQKAAWRGSTEAAKLLLEAGADVNAKDKWGMTPFDWADTDEIKQLLGKRGAKTGLEISWPLHWAAEQGNTRSVIALVKAGTNVNARTESSPWDGRTPLHFAAGKGQMEVTRILLEAGANVNARDKLGETPLDMTKDRRFRIGRKKQAKCARLLRKHGAKTGAELRAEAEQGKQ